MSYLVQNLLKLILKSPGFIYFRANLTLFSSKPDISGDTTQCRDGRFGSKVGQIGQISVHLEQNLPSLLVRLFGEQIDVCFMLSVKNQNDT